MKSYYEMVNDVFCRIREYEHEKKIRRKRTEKIAASFCCASLVVLTAFGTWKSGLLDTKQNDTADDSVNKGEQDYFAYTGSDETSGDIQVSNKIIINKIDGISSDRMKLDIDVDVDDYVSMDRSSINEYYGINIFPDVPEDLSEGPDQQYGIYRKDGTGAAYYDVNILNYSNSDFSRSVNIEMQKGGLPVSCYAFFGSIEEKSVINGTEVGIAISEGGYYYAEFIFKNVGFRIVAEGLSQEELTEVISSIIK